MGVDCNTCVWGEEGFFPADGDGRTRSDLAPKRERQRFQRDRASCPVTGRLSDVLRDYIIFPIVLGEGRYGLVRECVCRATRRTYACKTIYKSMLDSIAHIRREVRLLSEVDHRGIVRMVGCYEDATCVHIVTEKCAGGELFNSIADNTTEGGCYPEQRAAVVVRSLLESVAYLHERGIVHRDIKPENVLLKSSRGTEVRLADFGLSRRHRAGEPPMRSQVGTSYYMSPELLRGKYDGSCDVWSVGTIAYALLSGYPPFNGESDAEILESIRRGRFRFPRRQWRTKSDGAKDLIRGLLRKDPRERLTAKEALAHPWIVSGGANAGEGVARPAIRYLRIP